MAQTIWLNYLSPHTYTSFRHQADTHTRFPISSFPYTTPFPVRSTSPPQLFLCSAPPAGDLSALVIVLSLSPKLKRSLRDLESQALQGSIYPTGTRFHIPDFSLISGSPGDKASTRCNGAFSDSEDDSEDGVDSDSEDTDSENCNAADSINVNANNVYSNDAKVDDVDFDKPLIGFGFTAESLEKMLP